MAPTLEEELPMELIFDILSRLPVEPLVRFKPVCKTWYALIQNPTFIKAQLTKSDQNKLSLFSIGEFNETQKYTMWLHSSEKNHNLASNPNFLFKIFPRVVGICNGLVCATVDNYQAIICNPTIGRLRKLPLFSLPLTKLDREFLGFVFHDNEYKLFRIIYSRVSRDETETIMCGEVYNMSLDAWSILEVKNGEAEIRVTRKGFWYHQHLLHVAINEFIYWNTSRLFGISYVAYFDMKRYVFGLIHLPLYLAKEPADWQLVDLKGQLTIVLSGYEWLELWVFKEKESSWSMMHKTEVSLFRIQSSNLICLGCDRNDKLVMRSNSSWWKTKIFLYDQETSEITNLSESTTKYYSTFYLYTQSLFWHDVEDKCNS